MRRSRRQTNVRVGEDRVNRSCEEEAACEQGAQTLHFALRASHTQLTAKGTLALNAERQAKRRTKRSFGCPAEARRAGAHLSVLLSMRSLGHIIYMSHDSPIHNN